MKAQIFLNQYTLDVKFYQTQINNECIQGIHVLETLEPHGIISSRWIKGLYITISPEEDPLYLPLISKTRI